MIQFSLREHRSEAYEAMLELRDQVLRKPLGLTLDLSTLGDEENSYHLAGYYGERLCCCLVLTPIDENTVRMRQVAVHPDFQGKGIGEKLVLESERIAAEEGFNHIILHARKVVVGFYKKLQYTVSSEEFEEVGIPHVLMEKYIEVF